MKLFKPTLVALALVSVIGCQETKQEEKAPVLDTEVQKQAYGLGASIGMFTQRNLVEQEKLGLSLDHELLLRGFKDSLAGNSAIEKEEIQALMMNLEQTMKAKQQEVAAIAAEANIAEGKKFLEENAKKEGVQVTESGIQYSVITEGEGEKPVATDRVKVHYKGMFLNGEEFDSSYSRNQPAVFGLNQVIKGWTEGVQLMSVGSKYTFVIPSDLAYGPKGNPPRIPGNSVLQFEIELLEIMKPAEAPKVGDK
ncbi:FKBP-type peptidyl-prolyl cis-trans isomerase [Thalassotalea castellviae]|uniref:Peptidyl-prolyl cis-trans isomerase n=1 Tax=Thalassotalea castellviae TaxID=3075612 RepID=A0ABU3A1A0_9GAMM|nr:FKBP-type peptidyl-prolyl cis-trans isomerase [Thalassotalea sp. W431]MDT0603952.1 FKBP-type peptidyl-prolyl cis-trans isomerase [Thalassotalea sp. W431]